MFNVFRSTSVHIFWFLSFPDLVKSLLSEKVLCEPTLYSFCCCHCHVGDDLKVRKFLGNARTAATSESYFCDDSLSQNKSISGRPEVPFVHSVERIRMYGASKYKSFVLIF